MNERVAIVGVGWSGFRPVTPEVSYKELMYEAAKGQGGGAEGAQPGPDPSAAAGAPADDAEVVDAEFEEK